MSQLYTVQKIIDKRKNKKGLIQYKVKWKGYPMDQCTWQPYKNLQFVSEMIKQYENRAPDQEETAPVIKTIVKSNGRRVEIDPEEMYYEDDGREQQVHQETHEQGEQNQQREHMQEEHQQEEEHHQQEPQEQQAQLHEDGEHHQEQEMNQQQEEVEHHQQEIQNDQQQVHDADEEQPQQNQEEQQKMDEQVNQQEYQLPNQQQQDYYPEQKNKQKKVSSVKEYTIKAFHKKMQEQKTKQKKQIIIEEEDQSQSPYKNKISDGNMKIGKIGKKQVKSLLESNKKQKQLKQIEERTQFRPKIKKVNPNKTPPVRGPVKIVSMTLGKDGKYEFLTQCDGLLSYRTRQFMINEYPDAMICFYEGKIEFDNIPKVRS